MTPLTRTAALRALGCVATFMTLTVVLHRTEAWAETMPTSPALRQAAVTSCTGDVLRLCPTVMFDEEKIFACMKTNRAQLSPNCRTVFDQGAKTVHR